MASNVTTAGAAEAPQNVAPQNIAQGAVLTILVAISFCHLLNDLVQSLIPAIYPLLKESFHLDFAQIGLITLTFQLTASLLQPLVGLYTDRRPMPYSLPFGMGATLAGLLILAKAPTFGILLFAAALVGIGSSVFHPESSRIARMASGGRHGLAQSVFQLGGYAGSAIGPLLAAFIVLPRGQSSIAWFSIAALLGIVLLTNVGGWAKRHARAKPKTGASHIAHHPVLPFTLLLPYANLRWTGILSVVIGLILSSAFSAIVVYAQELLPGRVGMVSGLFFGLAFGMSGLGAAVLGELADLTSVRFVYQVCAFLPVIGLLTAFLPNIEGSRMNRLPAVK
jgi:predicted MFS family arabinose efflux permease